MTGLTMAQLELARSLAKQAMSAYADDGSYTLYVPPRTLFRLKYTRTKRVGRKVKRFKGR